MSSLSFPDVNVWLALATSEHVHSSAARHWWARATGVIAFCRFTQLGLLRLTTTAAAMDGQPLTFAQAWRVYDRFYQDGRVRFAEEPPGVNDRFRQATARHAASPKLWADTWLLATAQASAGSLVTFDHALAARGAICLLQR